MAKKNGNWWKIIGAVGVIVAILGTAGGIIYNHGEQAQAAQNTEKHVVELKTTTAKSIGTLKKEGCDVAEETKDRIIVVETELEYIKKGQEELKTGQQVILKAIRER